MELILLSFYVDISSGILIQFGAYNTLNSNTWITITFPTGWKLNTYTVSITQRNDDYTEFSGVFPATCISGFKERTTTNCKMGFRYISNATNTAYISWIAIGN